MAFGFHLLVAWSARWAQWHALKIPGPAPDWYPADLARRAAKYHRGTFQLGLGQQAVIDFLVGIFLLFALPAWWLKWCVQLTPNDYHQGLMFAAGIFLFFFGIQIPFAWQRVFGVEQQFGFNTNRPWLWMLDVAKSLVLSLVMGGLLLAAALWFYKHFPETWWLWILAGFVAWQGLWQFLAPWIIAPWFNRFTPIAPGRALSVVREVLHKAGLEHAGIFCMDASRRSCHANAYVSGLGKRQRVVLFDTLLERLAPAEIGAVLAHELGHWKQAHLFKLFLANAALGGCFLFVLGRFIAAGGSSGPASGAELAYIGLLTYAAAAWITTPLQGVLNIWSRHQELEADRYAVSLLGESGSLISALSKLGVDNLSYLYPHPWYVWLYATHPPLLGRLQALARYPVKKANMPALP